MKHKQLVRHGRLHVRDWPVSDLQVIMHRCPFYGSLASGDTHDAGTRPFSWHRDDRHVKRLGRFCIATANAAPRSGSDPAL